MNNAAMGYTVNATSAPTMKRTTLVDALDEAISRREKLSQLLSVLEERLKPAIAQEPLRAELVNNASSPLNSPLAMRVHELTRGIDDLADRIGSLLDHLEV